jgi:c-di-GMP-binding flagellar brake protein YcgR
LDADNRKNKRFKINRKVMIRLSDGNTVTVHACDISEEGIGLLSPYNADVGAMFDIYFDLFANPQNDWIHARAQIRFVNLVGTIDQYRIGMQFVTFFGDGKETVLHYLKQRMSQPGWM